MNATTNYQLNQWAKSDQVKMEDFNADNAKIDAAIKAVDQRVDGLESGKADKTALAVKAEIIVGTYVGDGAAQREIVLGRRPKAVLVTSSAGYAANGNSLYGGLAVYGAPALIIGDPILTVTDTGFTVYYRTTSHHDNIVSNGSNNIYHYIAFF